MCGIWKEKEKKELILKDFQKIINSDCMKNIKYIGLTGGEPFLLKNIDSYLQEVKKKNPKIKINISSNGYFTDKLFDLVKKNVDDADRLSITLSFDGIKSHDYIREDKSKEKLFLTYKKIKELVPDFKIDLKFTITPWNYKETSDTCNFLNEKKIFFQIKIMDDNPAHTNKDEKLPLSLNAEKRKEIVKELESIMNLKYLTNKAYLKNITGALKTGDFSCRWPKNTVFISSRKEVYLCRKEKSLGSLANENLSDIMNSDIKFKTIKMMKACNKECFEYSYK
jgi:MoaA/NifB/PqqE/SkfB family radical SAM enzyme